MTPNQVDLKELLKRMVESDPNVNAAVIITTDGLIIASSLPHGLDEIRFASMGIVLFLLSNLSVNELQQGEFDHLSIKSSEGYLLVMRTSTNLVLILSTRKDVRLQLIFLECKRICEKIAKLIYLN